MSITTIIPSYNCGHLTCEAVRSVLAQSVPVDEVIVVDDGSTDDTQQLLAAFGAPVKVVYQANQGVAAARNHGLRLAKGDLIAFLDADDVWHPKKLEYQLSALSKHPDLGLLATQTYAWPAECHPELSPDTPVVRRFAHEELLIRNLFTASSVIVRRSVLEQVGEFDIHQFGTEDYDLWLRIARLAPIVQLELPLTGYRSATPGSLSKNAARMEAGMRLIQSRLDQAGVFAGRGLLRRKARAYHRYTWAYMHLQAGNSAQAVKYSLASLLGYPFFYNQEEVRYRLGRLRLAFAALRQSFGLGKAG